MANKSAKKVRGHPELEPGEEVVDACWGAGQGFLRLADFSSYGGTAGETRMHAQSLAALDNPDGSEAARIDKSGILAVTDRRVLFLAVKTKVAKPKYLSAAWPLAEIAGVQFDKPMVQILFGDGSVGGLRVDSLEKPADFVAAAQARLSS